jgi:hypothetical protein
MLRRTLPVAALAASAVVSPTTDRQLSSFGMPISGI